MNTLRITTAAVGLIAGIVLAGNLGGHVPVVLLAAALAAGAALSTVMLVQERRSWRQWPRPAVLAAMLLVTLPLGYWRTVAVLNEQGPDTLRVVLQSVPEGATLQLRGEIAREPEVRSTLRTDLQLRVHAVRIAPDGPWQPVRSGQILVRVTRRSGSRPEAVATLARLSDPRAYGDRIAVSVRLTPDRPMLNPGQFDYAAFLGQQGLETSVGCDAGRVEILETRRGNPVTALALAAKRRFLETYRLTIRSPASRLAAAATLGNRRALDGVDFRGFEITSLFRHAGVGHVLAVSGLHVSVITVLLYVLFRMVGLRPRLFVPPLIVFLLLFAILTGARPSSVRAVIMNAVILSILAYGHGGLKQATAAGLGWSALAILLHHPLVLYAPSFLLSYGAVLSLLVLAPPLDRALLKLRGFGLLFCGLWLAGVLLLAARAFPALVGTPAALLALALLWLGILGGHRLNDRMPGAWRIGLHRLPGGLRIFLSAQLAIQLGMMIPMSAWFFGQLPVAGVLVNLLAIPLVGILVQLGMLTGLLGLVPGAGLFLAAPFGAATTVVGGLFLYLALGGALLFPFPAVPQPSLLFLTGYYLVLLALVLLERQRGTLGWGLQAVARRLGRPGVALAWLLPLLLGLTTLYRTATREPAARTLLCLADGDIPLLAVVSDTREAVLINAGSTVTGRFLLFDALRQAGAIRVAAALLPATRPRSGMEGLAELASKMEIGRIAMPVAPDDPADLLAAIGDPYLSRKAAEGERWALAHEEAYRVLQERARDRGTVMDVLTPGSVPVAWQGLRIETLPVPPLPQPRFVQSGRTPVLAMTFHGTRWIVVTDTTPDALAAMPPQAEACDVLLLPDVRSRQHHDRLIAAAIEAFAPRFVILAGDTEDAVTIPLPGERVIATGRDGAVTAVARRHGGVQMHTQVSRRTFLLHPPVEPDTL